MSDPTTPSEAAPAAPAQAPAAAPAPAAPAASPAPAAAPASATPPDESQPASAPAAEGQGKPGEEGKPAEPVYEYQMPEGVVLDATAAESLTTLAKEHGLAPEVAQKVADIGAKMMQRQVEKHAEVVASWIDEVKSDKEIGGDKLDASLAHAKQAMDFIGDPALKELLNTSGYGNHPVLVRAFVKIGKHLAPDKVETGRQPDATAPAARMYSASNMNP